MRILLVLFICVACEQKQIKYHTKQNLTSSPFVYKTNNNSTTLDLNKIHQRKSWGWGSVNYYLFMAANKKQNLELPKPSTKENVVLLVQIKKYTPDAVLVNYEWEGCLDHSETKIEILKPTKYAGEISLYHYYGASKLLQWRNIGSIYLIEMKRKDLLEEKKSNSCYLLADNILLQEVE